jgi:serine/threonine protein phosphatase 1
VQLRADDLIITLGDYCDRGPHSCAVFDWLIDRDNANQLRPLRGNHDIMMLNARDNESVYQSWLRVGGDATLRSYAAFAGDTGGLGDIPDRHWQFLADRLLPYFATETHFFVHASAYPDLPLNEQPDFMLYWEKFDDPPRHESGKTMICGHTSQKSGLPRSNGNAVCIDTWACGDGWLTCLHVESGELWQANQRGETRRLWLDELD